MKSLKLRKDAEKSPILHALVVWLFAVGIAALPYKRIFGSFIQNQTYAVYAAEISVRCILSAVAVYFIIKYRFTGLIKGFSGKAALLTVPAFLVAVNNFPIIAFITGDATLTGEYIPLFLVNCLFIGAFEETVFRGLVFPLIYVSVKDKKYSAFFSAAVSSAVFAASHLINLFGGAGIGETFLQVGYSFLIGGMCAVTVLMTGKIFIAVILHFIYDIGGLIFTPQYGVAQGFQWDTATIIITAVIGVSVAVYMVIYALKNDSLKLKSAIYSGYSENE
ncbi:MAG: CPBP family intramembrane glutamic endopeptidase [Clostridia bacterium]|nr:CPBP family intramembrane glutamic endopeptidase [Clostridia bacterium]